MFSQIEMFSTISGDVELPKTFINSLRILFDILDEDKDGFVPVAEIEHRWQGDGLSGLPNGVLQSLRKVAPENGLLNFDLFCSALKLTLKTNKERAKSKEYRQPNKAAVKPNNFHPMRSQYSTPLLQENTNNNTNNIFNFTQERLKPKVSPSLITKISSPQYEKVPSPQEKFSPPPIEKAISPKSKEVPRHSHPPSYTFPHHRRTPTHGNLSRASTTRDDKSDRYHTYAAVRSRPMLRSPHPHHGPNHVPTSVSQNSSSLLGSSMATPTKKHYEHKSAVKSPPPYMAHVKPQNHKVIKAQLVYPQNSIRPTSTPLATRESSPPPRKTNRRNKEEPRRHTLSSGITTDFNALKRMKDLEHEKDVLHQGLDLLEKGRIWYQDELLLIKEQQHHLITGKDMNRASRQDKVTYRTGRIMEINQQMRALMNSNEGFPDHMNLAMPQRSLQQDGEDLLVNKLKDQNKKLTQDVSFKSDRINALEEEKAVLIRQLFDVRGKSHSRERPRMLNTTLL